MTRWGKPSDRRYRTRAWKKLRLAVLVRDGFRCQIVEGCEAQATTADHIRPVYEGMPDVEFFDPGNLRAGCWRHNVGRGFFSEEVPGDASRRSLHTRNTLGPELVR